MGGMIKRIILGAFVLGFLAGNTWAGWFSFEPNIVILDGTAVAVNLEDIEEETAFLEKGAAEQADQLIKEEKVYLIQRGKDMTRVKYVKHEKDRGHFFVMVQDESGSKLWANMAGLACVDKGGKPRPLTEKDLDSGSLEPLPETVQ